jgi:hypothetical protein
MKTGKIISHFPITADNSKILMSFQERKKCWRSHKNSGHSNEKGICGMRTSTGTFLGDSSPAISMQPTKISVHNARCDQKLSKSKLSWGFTLSTVFLPQKSGTVEWLHILLEKNIASSWSRHNVTFWDVFWSLTSQLEWVSYVDNKPPFLAIEFSALGKVRKNNGS